MERKKKRERRGERDEESIKMRDRWGSEWLRERGRLLKGEKEREREGGGSERERERRGEYENREGKQMCQNCMPTINVNTR